MMTIPPARRLSSRRSLRSVAAACALALLAGAPVLPAVHADPAAPAATAFDATNAEALRPHVGEKVTVQGTVTGSGQSKTGSVAYLNFAKAHSGVALVFFLKPGTTGKAGTADDLKPFVGKSVTVSGKLADYKGDLQIVVESLDDLKVAP